MIRDLTLRFAHWRLRQAQKADARARLAADVERRKQSFAVRDFARRRAAMLKVTRGIQA